MAFDTGPMAPITEAEVDSWYQPGGRYFGNGCPGRPRQPFPAQFPHHLPINDPSKGKPVRPEDERRVVREEHVVDGKSVVILRHEFTKTAIRAQVRERERRDALKRESDALKEARMERLIGLASGILASPETFVRVALVSWMLICALIVLALKLEAYGYGPIELLGLIWNSPLFPIVSGLAGYGLGQHVKRKLGQGGEW